MVSNYSSVVDEFPTGIRYKEHLVLNKSNCIFLLSYFIKLLSTGYKELPNLMPIYNLMKYLAGFLSFKLMEFNVKLFSLNLVLTSVFLGMKNMKNYCLLSYCSRMLKTEDSNDLVLPLLRLNSTLLQMHWFGSLCIATCGKSTERKRQMYRFYRYISCSFVELNRVSLSYSQHINRQITSLSSCSHVTMFTPRASTPVVKVKQQRLRCGSFSQPRTFTVAASSLKYSHDLNLDLTSQWTTFLHSANCYSEHSLLVWSNMADRWLITPSMRVLRVAAIV